MSKIEKMRLEKLKHMLEWRTREEASGHQHAEAEALAWGLMVITDCLNERKDNEG